MIEINNILEEIAKLDGKKYCNSGNNSLYPLFWSTLEEARPCLRTMNLVAWHDLNLISLKLRVAAESAVFDDKPYRSTMLYDLSECLNGDK